jgi:Tfp pilus assembly protein PilO
MNEKKAWIAVIAGSVLVAVGAGALIYFERESIAASREEVAQIRANIQSARNLLKTTTELEREVIVLRETEEVIKEILPDEQDVNNFVRDLRRFEEDSEVRITGLKKKQREASQNKQEFDKVAYQLTFEADAFQLLSFLDRIESHSRFMRVPSFKLSAASRRQVEERGVPAHKVQMDVETYVYGQPDGPPPVKVDGYSRKRELLLGEIIRRQQALRVGSYSYQGPRSRRDPWVDPRIPVDTGSHLPIEEQQSIVQALIDMTKQATDVRDQYQNANNVIEEMTYRSQLETLLAQIEEDVRRIVDQKAISYVPAERRLHLEVIEPISTMRADLEVVQGGDGPTANALKELLKTMTLHINANEHRLALNAYETIKGRLDLALKDPARRDLVQKIEERAQEAQILSDFEERKVSIEGVAIQEGSPPIALINGKALGEGDLVDNELVIGAIRPGEIEFIFRGVVLIRRF